MARDGFRVRYLLPRSWRQLALAVAGEARSLPIYLAGRQRHPPTAWSAAGAHERLDLAQPQVLALRWSRQRHAETSTVLQQAWSRGDIRATHPPTAWSRVPKPNNLRSRVDVRASQGYQSATSEGQSQGCKPANPVPSPRVAIVLAASAQRVRSAGGALGPRGPNSSPPLQAQAVRGRRRMEDEDGGGHHHHHAIRVPSPESDVAMEEETSKPNHSRSLKQKADEVIATSLETYRSKPFSFWLLLCLSSGAMLTAFPASSLLSRLYYNDGGQSKWILSWAAVAGWPLPALLLLPLYLLGKASPTPLSLALCFWYVLLGFLSAADNLMYAWAYAYLPASTASLVAASSLAFSALFGRAIAKNRLNLSSLNAVVVITAGVVIVALDSGSDRPPGVTARQYALGFVLDVLGSALHGLIFALSELVFAKVLGRRSFHVVLEQQAAVSLCAFAFTSVGLAVAEGFPAMRREAARFAHGGEAAYANVMVWTAVTFQLGVLGGTGVLFLASTVLAGVLNAVRVPLTSIAAVIWFHDPMSGFKILALVITVWGFASYMVGHSSAKKTSTS